MITKEYLEEYEKDKKNFTYEINKLEKEINIEYKNTVKDSVNGSRKSFPYVQSHIQVEGINNRKIKRLEKRQSIYKHKLEKINDELQYKLDNLEDRVMADIIEQKYKDDKSWNQISMRMSYATESGARNYFERYFKKI